MLDVVIVGGSVAGLSAALYLGRTRRRVTIFDTNQPCNRFSHAAHGFLTRDHVSPAELIKIAREQLTRYETINTHFGKVIKIEPKPGYYDVQVEDGNSVTTRKVLLATGVRDELPPIPGIEPLWGQSVFHCAFCDGWEQHDQPVAILANGKEALHGAYLLRNLTDDLILCTGGPAEFSEEQRVRFEAHGIRIIETPIACVNGKGEQLQEIVFADGSRLPRHALFIRPTSTQHSPLAIELGCDIDELGLVKVDELGHTNIPGIYAAGDMTMRSRQILFAAKSGASAAMGINFDLISELLAP